MRGLSEQEITGGYVSSSSPLVVPAGSLAQGSKNLILTGAGKTIAHTGVNPQVGKVGSRELFNLPDNNYAGLGNGSGGGGSIIGLIAKAIAFNGSGLLTINGVVTALSASTALQILLYHAGAYDATAYLAGLTPPSAPTIAEHSVDTSTVNTGTASAVIWFVRSATGGRSRKSPVSNLPVVNGKKLRLTVAGSDLTSATAQGADRIGIGVPQWGFGATGPHFELKEIAISLLTTVDGVANSVELEWASAELQGKDLAPLEDDPPPAAPFCAALEDVVAVIGAYGDLTSGVSLANPGTAISVSLRTFIESFPADYLLYLPGSPKGVLPRPSDGFAFVGGLDFMCALVYTGATPPLSLQTIWDGTGISAKGNMFLGKGGRLVAFTGQRGIVRIGAKGEPESEWAKEVAEETAGWTPADVVGGWDNDYQLEVFFHHQSAVCYNAQIDAWCAPLDLSGAFTANEVVASAVTVGGKLYFATRDAVTPSNPMKVYMLHGGTGTTYEAVLAWNMAQGRADEIFQIELMLRVDNLTYPLKVRLYKDGDRTNPVLTEDNIMPPRIGSQHLTLRRNVRGARSYCAYVSQRSQGGDCGIDSVKLLGEPSGVTL